MDLSVFLPYISKAGLGIFLLSLGIVVYYLFKTLQSPKDETVPPPPGPPPPPIFTLNKIKVLSILSVILVLGGITITTAVKLYQTRFQPVAPTVPQIVPKAAGELTATDCTVAAGQISCDVNLSWNFGAEWNTNYIIRATVDGQTTDFQGIWHSPSCRDNKTNCESDCGCKCDDTSPRQSSGTCADKCGYPRSNSGGICQSGQSGSKSLTLACNKTVVFRLYNLDCNYGGGGCEFANATAHTSPCSQPPALQCDSTCTSTAQCPSGLVCDTASKKCRNQSCLTQTNCVCPPVLQCNSSCVTNSDCPSGLSCNSIYGNKCRNASCVDRNDCNCVKTSSCNSRCENNSDCPSDLTCSDHYCRRPACRGESDCVCKAPPPPPVPQSGNNLPTVITGAAGLGLLILGLLAL